MSSVRSVIIQLNNKVSEINHKNIEQKPTIRHHWKIRMWRRQNTKQHFYIPIVLANLVKDGNSLIDLYGVCQTKQSWSLNKACWSSCFELKVKVFSALVPSCLLQCLYLHLMIWSPLGGRFCHGQSQGRQSQREAPCWGMIVKLLSRGGNCIKKIMMF